jgi:acetyltransferase-like isoleucine patch superfamily enzyme
MARCGHGFTATERANIFSHGAKKANIHIGPNALIDGTVEVYEAGRLVIGSHFFLGRSRIYCAHEISIGDFVLISDNVAIMDSDLHPLSASARRRISETWAEGKFPDVYAGIPGGPVRIESDAWIGYGASVLKGVTIGRGAVIAAGATVTRDVPAWSVAVGSPAKVVRELSEFER